MVTIALLVYFSVGAYALFQCLSLITNEKVQQKSKVVREVMDIYYMSPMFVTVFLFVFCVVLWLPAVAYFKFFSTQSEDDEKVAADAKEISKILKGEDLS